jgi:hypothetical protein
VFDALVLVELVHKFETSVCRLLFTILNISVNFLVGDPKEICWNRLIKHNIFNRERNYTG